MCAVEVVVVVEVVEEWSFVKPGWGCERISEGEEDEEEGFCC